MIHIERSAWQEANELLADFDKTKNPVNFVLSHTLSNQGELSKMSGLNPQTLKIIREGKKPTKAQLAALKYALLLRAFNLRDM